MAGNKNTDENPELKEVESGSDADQNPTPKVGETPPSPNGTKSEDEKDE
ncbi:MAG TPA: hypothetical protein VGO22_23830 [Pseudorhizobium sp.]|nr:hypothetical protein [Pseudorhizobium sp.]